MNVFTKMVLIAALTGTAMTVSARDPAPGYYLGAAGALEFKNGEETRDQALETGGGGVAYLGYALRSGYRVEAELGFRSQANQPDDLFHVLVVPPDLGQPGGRAERWTIMANVYRDIVLNERWDYYLGVGAGVMSFSGRVPALYPYKNDYSDITKLGGQLLTGFVYHVNARLAFTGGYRISVAEKAAFRQAKINTGPFHSLELGLRWRL